MRSFASLLTILLAAFALRTAPLTQNRFHPDEAWYAHFALRITSGRDPWLHEVIVDKPPLPFYLAAGSLSLIGPSPRENPIAAEFGLRLPSLAAGVVAVALLFQLGRALYGPRTGRLAALIMALSPLAILFSITLFTDSLLTAFLIASMWAAARRRWGWSGMAFALAFASKQTALFFAPVCLVLGLLQLARGGQLPTKRSIGRAALRWLAPVIVVVAAIILWDTLRQAGIGFWAQGYADNNPRRFIRSSELVTRLADLLRLAHNTTGSIVANLLVVAGSTFLAFRAVIRRQRSFRTLIDIALIGFALGYLAVYWLLAFNLWDRYFVALTPIVALLLARVVTVISNQYAVISNRRAVCSPLNTGHRSLVTGHRSLFTAHWLLPALLLAPPALRAADSGYPVGGDHGAYDGIEQIAARVNAFEEGSVLYDYWLSWELSFYTFDGPAYLAWMSGPSALTEDLTAHGASSARYFVAPAWESFAEMEAAVRAAGYDAEALMTTSGRDGNATFTLYEFVPDSPHANPSPPAGRGFSGLLNALSPPRIGEGPGGGVQLLTSFASSPKRCCLAARRLCVFALRPSSGITCLPWNGHA